MRRSAGQADACLTLSFSGTARTRFTKTTTSHVRFLQVPPFGAGAVRATIERSFRRPVEDIFEEFSFKPIAAASLGQVHLAKLNGKRVVVKVQRPGLKELFDVDLKNVRVIAQWLQVCFCQSLVLAI